MPELLKKKFMSDTVTLSTERPAWHRYVHLLVVYLVWGSTYFAVKIALHGETALTPLAMQTWRNWFAGLLLVALAFATSRRLPRLGWREGMLCAVSGILMWVLGNGLSTLASRHAASTFIVMAMGMTVLVVMSRLIRVGIARRDALRCRDDHSLTAR